MCVVVVFRLTLHRKDIATLPVPSRLFNHQLDHVKGTRRLEDGVMERRPPVAASRELSRALLVCAGVYCISKSTVISVKSISPRTSWLDSL